jgi:hypothetical protein
MFMPLICAGPIQAIDESNQLYPVLCTNLTHETVRQMRHVAASGARFVVPIPFVTIIDPVEYRP